MQLTPQQKAFFDAFGFLRFPGVLQSEIGLCAHAATEAAIADLEEFIGGAARFWIDEPFSETMRRTAPPERMRHLEQVLAHSKHLPELAARARATMKEPSRG